MLTPKPFENGRTTKEKMAILLNHKLDQTDIAIFCYDGHFLQNVAKGSAAILVVTTELFSEILTTN